MIWFDQQTLNTEQTQAILSELETVTEVTPSELYITAELKPKSLTVQLYNTDPENWNLFMFPYNSEKFRFDFNKAQAAVFVENPEPFFEKVKIRGADFILPTMFEIKTSQSTGKKTLYVFTHEKVSLGKPFTWESKQLNFTSEDSISKYFNEHGQKYSSNTLTTLLQLWEKLPS